MSVTFAKDATSVVLRSPVFPYRVDYDPVQVKSFTEGGTLIVQDLGSSEEVVVLQFANLSTTQRDNLYSFFKTTLNGAATTFTYTDPASAEHTARWMDDVFDFQQDSDGRWSGTVTLRYE